VPGQVRDEGRVRRVVGVRRGVFVVRAVPVVRVGRRGLVGLIVWDGVLMVVCGSEPLLRLAGRVNG
jgi:hypothetical protein